MTRDELRQLCKRLTADLIADDFTPWCNAGCLRSDRPCDVPCGMLSPQEAATQPLTRSKGSTSQPGRRRRPTAS